MYQYFKDFAGPIATIAAAATAAYFVRRQALIAETQAKTALDQLRYNLFEKRWAIYEDVKTLIRLLVNESYAQEFRPTDVIPHYIVMNEARFFFSDEICSWMKELQKDCQKFLVARETRATDPKEFHTQQCRLVDHLTSMPERFDKELSFGQLKRPIRHARM